LCFGVCGLALLVVFSTWYMTGVISPGAGVRQGGFGHYSMNLNALWNPRPYSLFLKSLPLATKGQYEGFNYLGAGSLLLVFIGAGLAFAERSKLRRLREHWPLLACLGLFLILALSNRVTYGDHTVMRYDIPEFLAPFTGALRASGRLFWPCAYGLLTLAIAMSVRHMPVVAATALLLMMGVLQAVDVSSYYYKVKRLQDRQYVSRLQSPVWETAIQAFDRMVVYPPFEFTTENYNDFADLSYLAARHSREGADVFQQDLHAELASGRLEPSSFYVVRGVDFVKLYDPLTESAFCTELDGYKVCFPKEGLFVPPVHSTFDRWHLSDFLEIYRDDTILLAVKDEAVYRMRDIDKQYLREMGANIDELQDRGAYLAIVHAGKLLQEKIAFGKPVTTLFHAGANLEALQFQRGVFMKSAGFDAGNRAIIKIDSVDHSPNERGFNAVVLDSAQRVVATASFDTHLGVMGLVVSHK